LEGEATNAHIVVCLSSLISGRRASSRQMGRRLLNWTLLWRSKPRFSRSRSNVGSDLLWEGNAHEEEQNRGWNESTELAIVVPFCRCLS
jgi:hypothetical protein